MVRNGNSIIGGRDNQVSGPAKFNISKGLWLTGIFGVENDQAFTTYRIVDTN